MNAFSVSQAIIAAMITPALLIMASGSLIATGTARLGRIMDRVRELAEDDEKVERQVLQIYERRAILMERAAGVLRDRLRGRGQQSAVSSASTVPWVWATTSS